MSNLQGKVAVITGCAAGIGKQIAIRFAEDGANLAICDVNMDALRETARICEEKGADVLCAEANVKKPEDLEKFVEKTIASFRTIDILVNNAHGGALPNAKNVQAGFEEILTFEDTPIEHYQHFIEGNLYSTIRMMHLCIPYMSGKKDASIINYSSCSSKGMNGLGMGRYALGTAKGAVAVMSQLAAYELGQKNIRVNVIYPGAATDTIKAAIQEPAMLEQVVSHLSKNPLHRAGDPYEDIAPAVSFLASEDSKFMTGQCFYVNGGNWMAI